MAGEDNLGRGRRRWYDEPVNKPARDGAGLRRLMQLLFGAICLFLVLFCWRIAEPWLAPVVVDYRVLTIERAGDKVRLAGTFNKVRDCEFKSLTYEGSDTAGNYGMFAFRFLTVDGLNGLPFVRSERPGIRQWGPVELTLPSAQWNGKIKVYAIHSCWPLWLVETPLTEIDLTEN